MANVFISHRGRDIEFAERLAMDIQTRGHNVWLDKWRIDVGDSIIQKMNEGLAGSSSVIVCFSPEGLSPYMNLEWYVALKQQLDGQGVKVVPLLLPGGDPRTLPTLLNHIRYADARTDYGNALTSLINAIEKAP